MAEIIGHRGAAGFALENSPASIKAALDLAIEAIEIDTRLTKDHHLVVIHDKHTGRVSHKKLRVAESTLAELKTLALKNGEQILTLEEALKLIGNKKPLLLDLKHKDIAEELVPVFKKFRKLNITITSRNYPQLEKIHKLIPGVPFTARSYIYSTDIVHIAHNLGAKGISVNKWVLNPLTYHLAKRAGLDVHTYTVNHPWLIKAFSKLYPDLHIITDHPHRFATKAKHERRIRS
jgi:glycerophosphoryl diester phosphodiesterase